MWFVHVYNSEDWTSRFSQGTSKTRPCLSGRVVCQSYNRYYNTTNPELYQRSVAYRVHRIDFRGPFTLIRTTVTQTKPWCRIARWKIRKKDFFFNVREKFIMATKPIGGGWLKASVAWPLRKELFLRLPIGYAFLCYIWANAGSIYILPPRWGLEIHMQPGF